MSTIDEPVGPMYNPSHPGEFITAIWLEPFGISARTLASALGVATTSVTRILNGSTRITPEMALRLEAVLGRSAESWIRMQDAYDMWQARQTVDTTSLKALELVPA